MSQLSRRGQSLWLLAVSFGIGLGLLAGNCVSQGAVPDPGPNTAVVRVFVGGDRATPTTIAPLAGARFGLFDTEPGNYDPFDGYTSDTPLYTCTSDADGDCVFEVPIRSEGQVSPGTKLWVAPLEGPPRSGIQWFANPVWQTGPGNASQTDQTRHVFQTPALYANQTYLSGSNGFISQPGVQTSPPKSVGNYTRRIDSGGVWPLSRRDPDLPPQCGLNVALEVDLSGSMNGSVPALKTAMDAFVAALRGTPSRAALLTFSTNTPANNAGPNTQLQSVATTADANAFRSLYSGWTNATANGWTNWDTALDAAASSNVASAADDQFDLVVFMTDGNPTVYSPINGSIPTRSGYTRFREIGNAVASANRLKATGGIIDGPNLEGGTRVLAVGVGAGLNEGSDRNLRSISGRTAYDPSIPIADVDFYRVDDYTEVSRRLRELFLSACAPSVSVIKQVIPNGGTIADAYTPTDPWTYTATPISAGLSIDPPSASTSPATGALNFDLAFDEETSPATVEINETQKPGHTLVQVGGNNAVCVDKSEDDNPVPVTNQGANGFRVSLGLQSAVSCIVYNEEPDLSNSSVQVEKRWRINTSQGTEVFENGSQPSYLQADMTLTGPDSDTPRLQPWGIPRSGYQAGDIASFDEDVTVDLPGCEFTGATIQRGEEGARSSLDLSDPQYQLELLAGTNEFIALNDIVCHSNLRLLKQVEGGPADPLAWTLRAIEPTGALPGPNGTSGISSEVTDSVTYQLAEASDPADPFLYNFKQSDFRSRPLANPLSTGSMTCNVDAGSGDAMGGDGGVVVPRGQNVTCIAINRTSRIGIVKVVKGGNARPGDFQFTARPIDPDPAEVPVQQLQGASSPGSVINVRPEQRYRISESSKPGRYKLTSLKCTVNGDAVSPRNIVLPASAVARCRAVNSFSSQARVTVAKKANRKRVRRGQMIKYRIVVRSVGRDAARNVIVCDRLPRGLIFVRAPGSRFNDGRVCWTIQSLPAGARRILNVIMRVPQVGRTHRIRNRVWIDGSNVTPKGDVANVVAVSVAPRPPFTG